MMRAGVAVGAVMLPPDYGSKTCDEGRVLSGNRFGAGATSPGGLAATAAASRGDTRQAVAVDCSVGSGAWRQSGRPRTRSQLHGAQAAHAALGISGPPVSDPLGGFVEVPCGFVGRELRPGLSSWRTVGAPNSPCVWLTVRAPARWLWPKGSGGSGDDPIDPANAVIAGGGAGGFSQGHRWAGGRLPPKARGRSSNAALCSSFRIDGAKRLNCWCMTARDFGSRKNGFRRGALIGGPARGQQPTLVLDVHQLQLLLWNGNPASAQAAPMWRPIDPGGVATARRGEKSSTKSLRALAFLF